MLSRLDKKIMQKRLKILRSIQMTVEIRFDDLISKCEAHIFYTVAQCSLIARVLQNIGTYQTEVHYIGENLGLHLSSMFVFTVTLSYCHCFPTWLYMPLGSGTIKLNGLF
jgi:hypothetical protein